MNDKIKDAANTLVKACYSAAYKSGWWIFRGRDIREHAEETKQLWVATKLALVHSEVSEALEGLRKGTQDEHLPHRTSLEVEMADAVIRICDLAGGMGIDLGAAIAEKMAYNAKRADHKPEAREAAGGKAF